SESIQEARREGISGKGSRRQSREVWSQQVGAHKGAAAARAREVAARSASARRWRGVMKSPVVKRSIVVAGHKTSVSLEEAFWNGMKEISGLRNMTLSELVGEIDNNRQQGNL